MPVRVSKTHARILQHNIHGDADDVTPCLRRDLEDQHQILLVAHCRMLRPRYPDLRWLHASLNGVKLTPKVRGKAKMMGMEPGILDLTLLCTGINGAAGLAIDLKIPPNRATREQKEWAEHLRRLGWTTDFPTSAVAGWQLIAAHLGIDDKQLTEDLARRQALLG